MVLRRMLVLTTGVAVSAVCLSGCQEKIIAGFTVSPNGAVTISEVSIVTYDDSAGPLTVLAPEPVKLLAAAKKGTHAFSGPGVGKPVVRLVRLSKHVLKLTVSQTMNSLALLNKHGDAFDPASLNLDVSPAKGAAPTPQDPLGLEGPRIEKVMVQASEGDDTSAGSGTDGDAFHLTHAGHVWTFQITESAQDFAQERKSVAALTATAQKAGVSLKDLVVEVQVKLPGRVQSTNGKRLRGGVVSWDLLHLPSPTLQLTTRY